MAPRTWTRLIYLLCCVTHAHGLSSYVAAVYEHHVILNPEPRVVLSRREALRHVRQNVQVYEAQAASAARQGAQILVFPEDGLQGFNFTRASIVPYLEVVPNPRLERWNPCVHPERHPDTEVQRWLSCLARRHSLYVVANMGSMQPCSASSSGSSPCPADGRWHFNTNVVFRSDGELVARYHKQNLYFEEAFDRPPHTELSTFHTPFAGTFGLITCFDILFRRPTVALLQAGVRQLIFPTAWMNQLPLLDTIQFQRALSLGANVTLLAANIRNDELIMSGSGVYSPTSAVYHHAQSGDPEEGRLIVASLQPLPDLPLTDPDPPLTDPDPTLTDPPLTDPDLPLTVPLLTDPPLTVPDPPLTDPDPPLTDPDLPLTVPLLTDPPLTDPDPPLTVPDLPLTVPDPPLTDPDPPLTDPDLPLTVLGRGTDPGDTSGSCPADGCCAPQSFTSSMMHDLFRFVLVQGPRGRLGVCDGALCCRLQYRRTHTDPTELYALGAFAGLHTVNGNYSLQVCALVKCAGAEASSCGQEVALADTRMDFRLEGTFGTKHVFPSVLSSRYTLEQPTHLHATPRGHVTIQHSDMRAGLVTAALYGRMYHLDPGPDPL